MGRHFARPHLGKTPLKYYFRADNIEVSLPGLDVSGKLVVTWKRGHRKTSTDAFAVKEELSSIDGSISRTASTLEDLCLQNNDIRSRGLFALYQAFTADAKPKLFPNIRHVSARYNKADPATLRRMRPCPPWLAF